MNTGYPKREVEKVKFTKQPKPAPTQLDRIEQLLTRIELMLKGISQNTSKGPS